MGKGRLEAFSDGVLAIVITIMVLELHAPEEHDLRGLLPLWPTLVGYVLSFVYVGIYWNNHHHLLQISTKVSGGVLWANLHLLFWLSLVPFVTSWLGASRFAETVPAAAYGLVLLLAGGAYFILARLLIRLHGPGSPIERAIGFGWKEAASMAGYVVGIAVAFASPRGACVVYGVVALVWLLPDRRIERELRSPDAPGAESP